MASSDTVDNLIIVRMGWGGGSFMRDIIHIGH